MSVTKRQLPPDGDSTQPKVIKKRKQENGTSKTIALKQEASTVSQGKQDALQVLDGAASSKESHAKQRALAKERKAAKPNADSIHRAKKLWERLRLKSHVEKEEREKLVVELFSIVTGNVKDFVFKHDSVRTIECAIKYANKEQRRMIATELKGEYKNLAESRYAKFLVAKLLVSRDTEVNEMIISEFYGHVRKLINHPEASWILDDTYRQVATPRQKSIMLREWYGPEFAIFRTNDNETPSSDLVAILEKNPEKRKPIMSYLFDLINQLVQKKMVGFTMLHDAMLQYSLAVGSPASSEAATEYMETLKGQEEDDLDLLKNLGFTKSGSRVVSRALALGTAKDRKLLLRPFKDNIQDLAHDQYGHVILLTAYEVIDDTVLTAKTIISDLLATKSATTDERREIILEQATHPIARIPLLYLFVANSPKGLLSNDTHAAQILSEARTLRVETSKKDPATRHAELVKTLSQDAILLDTVAQCSKQLADSSFGCQFITEVLLGASSGGDKAPALAAVAALASGDPAVERHIARSGAGGRMLKTLVTGGRWDSKQRCVVKVEPPLKFAEVLYPQIQDHLLKWAVGDSSFVVANLLDEELTWKAKAVETLRHDKDKLRRASKEGNKGAGVLIARL